MLFCVSPAFRTSFASLIRPELYLKITTFAHSLWLIKRLKKIHPKKYFEYPDEIGRKLDLTEIERKSEKISRDDKPFMHAFKAHLTVIFIVIFMKWLF